MNPVIDTMMARRTIRKFKPESIPENLVGQLLEVIESTQSWGNTQCWEIVRVRDPEIRKQLQTTVPTQNPAFHAIVNAPELLVIAAGKGISGKINGEQAGKHGDWYMYDLGLATQNLCLAAHSLGLGTVVVGWFDQEKADRILNSPAGIEVVSLIPMGFRNQKGALPKHKPVESFLHLDRFGQN